MAAVATGCGEPEGTAESETSFTLMCDADAIYRALNDTFVDCGWLEGSLSGEEDLAQRACAQAAFDSESNWKASRMYGIDSLERQYFFEVMAGEDAGAYAMTENDKAHTCDTVPTPDDRVRCVNPRTALLCDLAERFTD